MIILSDRQSQKSVIPRMDLKLHQFWRRPGMGKTRGGQRQSPAMVGKQPVRTGSQWEFHLNLLIRDQWFRIFMAPVMAEVEQSQLTRDESP